MGGLDCEYKMKKKTEETPNQKLLTIEEAEAIVHQALEKGANPWTFTHHVWAVLETQVKAYLKFAVTSMVSTRVIVSMVVVSCKSTGDIPIRASS